MLLALLIIDVILCVALFLVFCRWQQILGGMSEDLERIEKGLRGVEKGVHQVTNPPAPRSQGEGAQE